MEHLRGTARPAAVPTDGELLDRFVAHRDEAAFGELVHRHGPLVHGVCGRLLENAADVEDAFQATFMVLVKKATSIRRRESAASWLYGVALRVARRARRAMGRRRERERRAAVPETVPAPDEAWDDLRPVLDDAVDRLPEKYRVLVVLCYLEGKTYEEAARLLRLAKGTVSTRLTQARVLLRRSLTRRGVALPIAVLALLLEHNAAPAEVPSHLPPLAIEAGRSAAGRGGPVSPRVAYLAQAPLPGTVLKPATLAALALALVCVAVGLLVWRGVWRGKTETNEGSGQVWAYRRMVSGHPGMAFIGDFSPDGKLLVTQAMDPVIRVWNVATGQSQARIQPDGFQLFVAFTPDSRTIVTAGDKDSRLWDAATGKEIGRFPIGGMVSTKLAPDGKSLAGVAADGAVHLIDLADRRERAAAPPPQPIRTLVFSSDSKTLAAGLADGVIELFDAAALKQQRRLAGNALPTLELAFSPDGTHLAALYGESAQPGVRGPPWEVKLWTVASGEVHELARHPVVAVAFSPDGHWLATEEPNGALRFWDPTDGTLHHRIAVTTQGTRLFHIVFSPDSQSVLISGRPRSVQVRDVADGRELANLIGHFGNVDVAAYSPDGRTLATGTATPNPQANAAGFAEVRIWERVK